MSNLLLIWGAGGHGKVVLYLARDTESFEQIVFLDDDPSRVGGFFCECPVVGGPEELPRFAGASFVVAVGDNHQRAECFERGLAAGLSARTLVHKTAIVAPSAFIGRGTVVMPGAVINPGAVIGANCIINSGAVVEHDCVIADHVHISPRAALGGAVSVGRFAQVGLGAVVLPSGRVGEESIVGAGAVVLRGVPVRSIVAGVPARVVSRKGSSSGRGRILLSVPHMGGAEQAFVNQAFASNWLSTVGPNLDAFEREFEEQFGLPSAALASGTAGIHLGLRLLGVGPGDEVWSPALTFAASCNPILYLGAEPVFLDSEYSTWNLDPNILEEALRDRASRNKLPRALVVVDLYGQCAQMDTILSLCREYGVPVLEDAAEALGATYGGRPAGTLGDIGVFSFNGNKIITTTGGGMLVSRNRAWVEKARFWSLQARDPGVAYEHSELGYNYRMSNVLAGIGRGQLEVLEARVAQRRAIAFRYREAFEDVPGISLMPQAAYGLHTNWLSCFLIDEETLGCSRDALIRALDQANIESRPVWKPMHLQPLYEHCERYGGNVAADLFQRGICLPSSSSLTGADQLYVVNTIRTVAGIRPLDRFVEKSLSVPAEQYAR
jgi:pyridoxal phosphate-dependent aminotransferase EpsN